MPAPATKFVRPGPLRRAYSRVLIWLVARGVRAGGAEILRLRGRATGALRSTPIYAFEVAGRRYLVGAHGTSQWVCNLRASRSGELLRGRRAEMFTATSVADSDKLPVLRSYVRAHWREVKPYFGLPEYPTDDEVRSIAHLHPVFVIDDRHL